ncbi:hypothetical protein M2451_003035 [Dysgonomonas sp. PFB1-18]|uniref:hypothetical protein n=2 Tax=Dysgonomonas TaxID=156973 RepID=UPI002473EB46|nr:MULTISPECIES: hypothetical protein [unclassified Dysgonomonas]MDH6310143.1 hypothetical protein [Dysgonomonas sp. PF1-14]MDH6340191.1 hypothetical protein [Dysgonomonas sp. PF1-16]MDH6381700.1 hypothetical protein [Dysgonomonas sp. PFB1-18]MDH6399059.1 hypothetical protein [Dysgonomonas sp. PF1-23]
MDIFVNTALLENFKANGNNYEAQLYKIVSKSHRQIFENYEEYSNQKYKRIQLIVDFISDIKDVLNSIAKGCFYNYDSLVINLHNYSYNARYYMDFIKTRNLDILQKNSTYKNLNPTTEANIIRAIYVAKKDDVSYSKNALEYLYNKIKDLVDKGKIERIWETKANYPKYKELSDMDLQLAIDEIQEKYFGLGEQLKLEI